MVHTSDTSREAGPGPVTVRVNRDYPKEIVSARSKIWPAYKKAREENARGTVHIGYPAKLIVHKRDFLISSLQPVLSLKNGLMGLSCQFTKTRAIR